MGLANTEVIDLSIENSTCTKFANNPVNATGPAGIGEMLGQNFVICGGLLLNDDPPSNPYFPRTRNSDECYIMYQSEAKHFAKMQEKRSHAASMVHNNKIWITGGKNNKVSHSGLNCEKN